MKEEAAKLKSEINWATSKCTKVDNVRVKVEQDLVDTKQVLKNIETEINSCRQELAQEKKSHNLVIREKNTLSKAMDNLKDIMDKMQQTTNISEQRKRDIEGQLSETIQRNNMANKMIRMLENQRDILSQDNTELSLQVGSNFYLSVLLYRVFINYYLFCYVKVLMRY